MGLMNDTAVKLSERIKAGEITVMDVAMATMDAIEEKEPAYHCYVTVLDRETVLKRAQEVQKLIDEAFSPDRWPACRRPSKTTCAPRGSVLPAVPGSLIILCRHTQRKR